MTGFDHINTWIFDLDNTLYPESCRLFDQMHVRMSEYIMLEFGVDQAEANRRRSHFYLKYGTTLRGLMVEHEVEPTAFLDYVHQIDYSAVPRNLDLRNALGILPGQKLVFTNGTTVHAQRVLERLGIEDSIDGIFDIVDSGYIPKPARAPYDKFTAQYGFDATRAAMFEDIDLNLEAPHEMGMTTVLITEDGRHDAPYVHHTTNNLSEFLKGLRP